LPYDGDWDPNSGAEVGGIYAENRTDVIRPEIRSLTINDGQANTGSRNVSVRVAPYDPPASNFSPDTRDDASGVVRLELSFDGTNWWTVPYFRSDFATLDGWDRGANYVLARCITEPGGLQYARFENVGGPDVRWHGVSRQAVSNIVPGKQYTLKIRYRTGNLTQGTVAVWSHWIGPGGIDVSADYILPASSSWTERSFVQTAPSGADTKTFWIGFDQCNLGAYIDVDWIEFWAGGPAGVDVLLPAGDGTKTVYARVTDQVGQVSLVSQASIYLVNDVVAPEVAVSINGGAQITTSRYVTLTVEARDNLSSSDMLQMRLSNDGGQTWSAWGAYAAQVANFDLGSSGGLKTVCVQVRDANGNVGNGIATIYYARPGDASSTPSDSTPPPTGGSQVGENLNGQAILLNGVPTVVVQGDSVTLSLTNINTQAGPVQLYVSFDGVNWSPPDQIPAGQSTFSKVLTFPREGTIAVSYKLKNTYGAESPVYTRYYLVDYTAPVIEKAEVLGGLTAVTSSTAPLLIRARDNLRAGMYYSLSLDGSAWTSWAALPSDGVVNSPTLASGYNRVRIKVIDRAGNAASATVGVFKL
jgi:hypothetical protein